MVGQKPEHWRILTPIFGVLNFIGMLGLGVVGWFIVRTVDQFDHHLEKLDSRLESQTAINTDFERRISLMQGQCCNRGVIHRPTLKDDGS